MMKISINDRVFSCHPVYDLYAGSEDGKVINIIKKVPCKGNKNNRGYMLCGVRKYAQPGHKTYLVHRFIYECFNGVIAEGMEIDHINNNKEDNRLCNLKLLTPQENSKKAVNNRDYSLYIQNSKIRRCVKAINKDTNQAIFFNSIYSAQQYLAINHATIKRVCEGYYGRKSGKSKKDGYSYTFEYVKEEDLPSDHIKSANIRPKRVPEEDKKKHQMEAVKKWQNKEYKCPECSKVIKNNSKYNHIKKCLT